MKKPKKEDIKTDRGPIVPYKRIEPGFLASISKTPTW